MSQEYYNLLNRDCWLGSGSAIGFETAFTKIEMDRNVHRVRLQSESLQWPLPEVVTEHVSYKTARNVFLHMVLALGDFFDSQVLEKGFSMIAMIHL